MLKKEILHSNSSSPTFLFVYPNGGSVQVNLYDGQTLNFGPIDIVDPIPLITVKIVNFTFKNRAPIAKNLKKLMAGFTKYSYEVEDYSKDAYITGQDSGGSN